MVPRESLQLKMPRRVQRRKSQLLRNSKRWNKKGLNVRKKRRSLLKSGISSTKRPNTSGKMRISSRNHVSRCKT